VLQVQGAGAGAWVLQVPVHADLQEGVRVDVDVCVGGGGSERKGDFEDTEE